MAIARAAVSSQRPGTNGHVLGRSRLVGALVTTALGLATLAACQTDPNTLGNAEALQQLSREPLDTQPWAFAHHPGPVISTEHYKIFTTLRDPLYQRLLARVLESTYARAQRFRPSHRVGERMTCYVFSDRGQWELHTKREGGSNAPIYLQISAGGYCQNGVFVGYHLSDGRQATLSVMAHEAWHQYSWFAFKDRLPSWLEEGLATQNESFEWNGTTPNFTPELNYRRFQALKQAVQREPKRLWKLSDLLSTHAGEVIKVKRDERDVGVYYAQLWALVLFLENSQYQPALRKLLNDAHEGQLAQALNGTGVTPAEIANFTERWNAVAGPAYMRAYINADLGQLEAQYLAFCRDLVSTWPPKVK